MSDDPLVERFPNLQPGKRPGSLGNVYGFGTTLIGRRDFDPETYTYVITHVFTALFIPIWSIAAYRVANAEGGGFYCLGRVPLSRFARGWNIFLMLAILGGAGGIWWNSHTKSPEYIAGRKLRQAEEAAAAGHGGEAAKLCREVMDSKTSKADEAKAKLAAMIDDPPGGPTEAAAVYQVAVDLHRANRCPVPDLFERGKALAARHAADDPAAALALLEVIAPFAPDTAAELDLRRDLLMKLREKSPDDPEIVSRLAAVHEEKGETEKCEQLLTPFEGRLGTLDGAAILGRIHAAHGKQDRAHALLAPFVAARLPALRRAEQDYTSQIQAAEDRVLQSLREEKAPGFDFERLRRGTKAQQQEMVGRYIADQLKDDPTMHAARQKLIAERGVVGAVLDLGLVQLQRGQAMADPGARKAELEAAEQTFLSIRGIAGESTNYRLSLGQVYYWLGRPGEGKKLIDELLTRDPSTMNRLLVVRVLREVGDTSAARRLAEEAHQKETDTALKYQAARSRSVLYTDIADQILWLARCDPNARDVQASLSFARGQKASEDGKDAEAAEQFRQSIATYAQLPEEPATLNNSALSHFGLFQITLDREEFIRGADKLDRAIALQPTNTVAHLNAMSMLSENAARDVVGKAVDFRALPSASAWEAIAYLYRSTAERAAVVERLGKHPGFVKSRVYAEKLLLISPKRDDTYHLLSGLLVMLNDMEGLKALVARATGAELDLADDIRTYQESLTGASDEKKLEENRTRITRTETGLATARAIGGRTLAVAIGRHIRAKTAGWVLGLPADPDELVKLAEEAHAEPSSGSNSALRLALVFRAHVTLSRSDPQYAAAAKKTQRSFGPTLVYYVLAGESPLRAKAANNADVKRLAAITEDDFKRSPEWADASEWVLLRAVGSPLTKDLGERAKQNERARLERELARSLSPYAAATALNEYWHLLLLDKAAEAKKVLADLAAKQVPVP